MTLGAAIFLETAADTLFSVARIGKKICIDTGPEGITLNDYIKIILG